MRITGDAKGQTKVIIERYKCIFLFIDIEN